MSTIESRPVDPLGLGETGRVAGPDSIGPLDSTQRARAVQAGDGIQATGRASAMAATDLAIMIRGDLLEGARLAESREELLVRSVRTLAQRAYGPKADEEMVAGIAEAIERDPRLRGLFEALCGKALAPDGEPST